MKFSIITPTIQRQSLQRCCASVDDQIHRHWEHIIFVDSVDLNNTLIYSVMDSRRSFIFKRTKYGNFGNTPRHEAWKEASGDYVLYLDDDNYLHDPEALLRLEMAITQHKKPKFAVIPCERFGWWFFNHPPGVCRTDSANLVIQREIGQWPNRDEYTLDGIFAEELHAKYGSTPMEIAPVIVVPTQGKGE